MATSGNISRRDFTSIMLWRLCTCVMVLAAVSLADLQMDTSSGMNMSVRDLATGEDDQDIAAAQRATRDAGVALSNPGKYTIEYKGFNYAESSPANFPDMDYGLMGYDILKGFPLAIGHDPGFTLPIFLADYSGGLQTADASWSLPKGVVAVPDVSCVTSFSSKVVKSSRALSKSMEASVGVTGGGWGVSFSASAGYQEASSEVSSGEYILIISKASCDYYYMQLKMHDLPPLDPSFLKWVIKLNNTSSDSDFVDFVETYGTHFVHKATFGASFTYEHKMSATDYETETSKGVDVSVSASYDGIVSVGADASLSTAQKAAAAAFRSKVTTKTITIGSPPPENGDALTWASSVKDNPLPVQYELKSIENLFSAALAGPSGSLKNIDFHGIKKKIIASKRAYCKRLLSEGLVDDCTDFISGLTLENTKLTGTFKTYPGVKSNSDCIDLCYDLAKCEAVDYCEKCASADSDYHKCRVYMANGVDSGTKNSKWETTILMPDLKIPLVVNRTGVVGSRRGLAMISDSPVSSAHDCFKQCAADAFCVAFSTCKCPEMKHRCKFYSDVMYHLTTEADSTLYFLSPDVKLTTPNLWYHDSLASVWTGPICSKDSDCQLVSNATCVYGVCLCPCNMYYSGSEAACVSKDYVNVAVGKTAKQSSTYYTSTADRAVDGNKNPDWWKNSCQHTDDGDNTPWWYVDLGAEYLIHGVAITNRGDCCSWRLKDFTVEVYENNPESSSSTAQTCYTYSGSMGSGVTETLACPCHLRGRYVRITKPTVDLTMCEVEVLAVPV